jgi:hypothetical protein
MLRVQTSFQDTPGDGHYFVLLYQGCDLKPQLDNLGLKDGDSILLWKPDCGDTTVEAILLVDYRHPVMPQPALWARAKKAV